MKPKPLVCFLIFLGLAQLTTAKSETPNIVYILADDLGYGDVHCLNPDGKIATPHIDQLAAEGMRFTDAHSSSSVCTPSRYSILTGRYNWRTHLQSGVPGGFAKPLIAPDRMTVATLLKNHGYDTACFGKWHLGMTLPSRDHLNEKILDTPSSRGFDEFFGIAASLDMPPYSFIDGDHFSPAIDTEKSLFMDRVGPAAKDFEAIEVLPMLTQKADEYIRKHAKSDKPFFLYLPLTAPHTPLVPSKEWQVKSGLGPYGDFVMQTDATIGTVLAALDETGIAEQTLVIVTSDNGCAPMAGVKALEEQGHHPSAQFRGLKSDIWEGGHRLPFVVRWPGKVAAGSTNPALICLGDFMATCADLLEVKLPDNAAEDSISILPLLLGKTGEAPRRSIVHHSNNGSFAIREGSWKLELCPGSGGWGNPTDQAAMKRGLPAVQLYDLSKDISETTNVEAEHPEVVTHLRALLEQQIADGRSTPGDKQQNDAPIVVEKFSGQSGK
ncbi:arylsulfatase [Luteolibacter pohnpeiensis]|uniref:Arylsulfatase n=1 Tax=Luteolibacter pohnpeiensis TaxID=454153 RepID=A0A934VUZ5_9BACT|nr:arylsulfatase [Luteolibacter pohnpeiensis]MBK1881273.1 arylsulfatase [Luteolibacter pohnpeiensis]